MINNVNKASLDIYTQTIVICISLTLKSQFGAREIQREMTGAQFLRLMAFSELIFQLISLGTCFRINTHLCNGKCTKYNETTA